VRFVPWYRLAEAAEHAPARPGVFQVRVESGLIDYPRGKSAMVHYGAADDVRAATLAFAAAHPGAALLCRHAEQTTAAADPDAVLATLLARFRGRFGASPGLPT
jgi:hypothetical protein